MTADQVAILLVLAATTAFFLWDRWRHDMVALGALLVCVLLGLVPGADAFAGFGHPAVTTVAAVLVLGYGLQASGVADLLARWLLPASAGPTISLLTLLALGAFLSTFMNNIGALALLMPVAIQMAARHKIPAGRVLMPLAFASILGGMVTLIGTPPNLIVSGFRASAGSGGFGMFAFAPTGLAATLLGVAFIGVLGWRLVPARKQVESGGFDSGTYLSEVRLQEGSKAVDRRLREVEKMLDDADAQIISLVRNGVQIQAPHPNRMVRADDILVIEIEPESLAKALSSLGLTLEEDKPAGEGGAKGKKAGAADGTGAKGVGENSISGETGRDAPGAEVAVQEFVVMPGSALQKRSAADIRLRTHFGINLLALSRGGRRSIRRLRSTRLKAGDVLLMQGDEEALAAFAAGFRCLPLAARDIRVPRRGKALSAALIMGFAVGVAAAGWWPASIAFAGGALLFVAFGVVPIRSVYDAIDWPVIVLLGAMLPVADALAATGAADLVGRLLLASTAGESAALALATVLVLAMLLSSLVNNAATAAVMCPIALGMASQLGAHPDGFLMAVAVGASCAFLTPIGHQNNTLILGPGGFRFGDYWRLGLPVSVLVLAVAVPVLLRVFPPFPADRSVPPTEEQARDPRGDRKPGQDPRDTINVSRNRYYGLPFARVTVGRRDGLPTVRLYDRPGGWRPGTGSLRQVSNSSTGRSGSAAWIAIRQGLGSGGRPSDW